MTLERIPNALDVHDSCSRMELNRLREERGVRPSIRVHGQEIARVVAYDLDAGWFEYQRVNDQGKPVVVGSRVATVRVKRPFEVVLVPVK